MLTFAGDGGLDACCPRLFWATSVMANSRAIFVFIDAAFLAKGCGPISVSGVSTFWVQRNCPKSQNIPIRQTLPLAV